MPVTGFASSLLDTKDLIKMVGGAPLILKLLEGAQGRGVVLAETQKEAESVINAMKSLNANLLVEEFIKEAGAKEPALFRDWQQGGVGDWADSSRGRLPLQHSPGWFCPSGANPA